MIKLRILFPIFLILIISCNSNKVYNSNENDQKWIAEFEIETIDMNTDTIVKKLYEFKLPEFRSEKINDSLIRFTFNTNFDSTALQNVFNKRNNIKFQETYDFESLLIELDPILKELGRLGCKNANRYLNYIQDRSMYPDSILQIPFFGGSNIGSFSINDKSTVESLFESPSIISKLPRDLILSWSNNSNPDSISLYLLKIDSNKYELDESNMINLKSSIKERKNPVEYEKNGNPKKWQTVNYYEIQLSLDQYGSIEFYELTNKNIAKYIAILINESVYSAPSVHMPIKSGQISISLESKNDLQRFYESILFKDYMENINIKRFDLIK